MNSKMKCEEVPKKKPNSINEPKYKPVVVLIEKNSSN